MKSYKYSFILLAAAVFFTAVPGLAQEVFSDPSVDYSFALPEAKWKMTAKPSSTNPNVAYVYGDRMDGHFEVRRVTVPRDYIMTDVIEREEKKWEFRDGFVAGKQENFGGRLRGTVYNFEYVSASRNMGGRFYFLKANDTTIYVLRFVGQKESLRSIRNQIDSIARTFSVNE